MPKDKLKTKSCLLTITAIATKKFLHVVHTMPENSPAIDVETSTGTKRDKSKVGTGGMTALFYGEDPGPSALWGGLLGDLLRDDSTHSSLVGSDSNMCFWWCPTYVIFTLFIAHFPAAQLPEADWE